MMQYPRGTIQMICGPMFSGKTEELVRRVRRMEHAGKISIVFKPRIDNRYNADNVCSHGGVQIKCVLIDKSSDIIEYISKNGNIDVVGIDEMQFMDNDIIEVVSVLAESGYIVIGAGLDKDFRKEPFGPMPELLTAAEDVTKLKAVCHTCKEDAAFTQRLIDGEPASYDDQIVLVGAKDSYEARCRKHHIIKNMPKTRTLIYR
jgi:thymidine kinase